MDELTTPPQSERPQRHARRRLAAVAIVLLGAGVAGGVARAVAQDEPSKPTSPTTVPAAANTGPARQYSPTAVLSAATRDCYVAALRQDDHKAVFDCLEVRDIVAIQRSYLALETDATDAQIDCVADRMNAMPVKQLRAAQESVGQNFYVPCGLPD